MDKQFTFSLQSLLEEKNGSISAPMSPMEFAKGIALQYGFKINRLARLWFADDRINQCREDGGLTGHDTSLIGTVFSNDMWISLWIDTGVGGIPIAMAFQSDGQLEYTEVYRQSQFARKLTDKEIWKIFKTVFEDYSQINIKKA